MENLPIEHSQAREELARAIPEQCRGCPTATYMAGQLAIEASMGEIPLEEARIKISEDLNDNCRGPQAKQPVRWSKGYITIRCGLGPRKVIVN